MDGFDSPIPEVIDLDAPRDGVPLVIETQSGLERCAAAIAAGTGPAGVDAERASGFRYGQRAFLVQIRREGSGTWLIDPEPFGNLDIINDALQRRRMDPARGQPGPALPVRTGHVAGQTL